MKKILFIFLIVHCTLAINNCFCQWQPDVRLTNDTAQSNTSYNNAWCIAASGDVVHVVWRDNRDGNREIYYKRSTDGGVSWGTDARLTNNSAASEFPSVSVSGQVVHVVWEDERDGNWEIYYKRSTDEGISWGADTRLTNNSAFSEISSVSVSGQVVHVVWRDNRDGNYEIYYKRDPTGNPIGIININSELPNEFSLSQNYPNPFNPTTKIRFQIPKSGFVNMAVYDIQGREIAALVNEELNPGTYEAEWFASEYSSGIYFYKLITQEFSQTMKMVLIK